jgi:hypothetical protein
MTTPAKTVQPIHFEDFDGSQFERLVFAYHPRADKWRSLESYGQTGSDLGRNLWGVREDGSSDGESVCVQCAKRAQLKFHKAKRDVDKLVTAAKMRDGVKQYAAKKAIRECDTWSANGGPAGVWNRFRLVNRRVSERACRNGYGRHWPEGWGYRHPTRAHPEQLQSPAQHAAGLALDLAKRLVEFYAPAKWPQLQAYYLQNIRKRSSSRRTRRSSTLLGRIQCCDRPATPYRLFPPPRMRGSWSAVCTLVLTSMAASPPLDCRRARRTKHGGKGLSLFIFGTINRFVLI